MEMREKDVSWGACEWNSTLRFWGVFVSKSYVGLQARRLPAYLFEILQIPLITLTWPVSREVCRCLVANRFWANLELLRWLLV